MLADTFANLLRRHGGAKRRAYSRKLAFLLSTQNAASTRGRSGFNRATFVLFAAMLEAMRAVGAQSIVTVTDARMERILRRASWPLG